MPESAQATPVTPGPATTSGALVIINQNVIDVAKMLHSVTALMGEWHGSIANRLDAIDAKLAKASRKPAGRRCEAIQAAR